MWPGSVNHRISPGQLREYQKAVEIPQVVITIESKMVVAESRSPDDKDDAEVIELVPKFPDLFTMIHEYMEAG